METLDLASDFSGWKNGTAEGKIEVTEAACHTRKNGLRWTVSVDYEHDGGEGGSYPVGWPRLGRDFKPGELDISSYDILEMWIRIDSDRDEVADDHTPIGLSISAPSRKRALYQRTIDLGGEQHIWLPIRIPIKQMMSATDAEASAWKSISRIQLHLSEHDYKQGTRLTFDIGEVSLLRLTQPMIAGIDAPHHVLLPRNALEIPFDLLGSISTNKGCKVVASLETANNQMNSEARQKLEESRRIILPIRDVEPGDYTLRLTLVDSAGKRISESVASITMHPGPFSSLL